MNKKILAIIAGALILGCTSNQTEESHDLSIDNYEGLEYFGKSGDYEMFYSPTDSSFAIYVENFIYFSQSFEAAKQAAFIRFSEYSNLECQETAIKSIQALECTYYEGASNTSFKSIIMYKDSEYIHLMLSAFGEIQQAQDAIFDNFIINSVVWK